MEFLFKYVEFFPEQKLDLGILKIGVGHIVDKFHDMKEISIKDSVDLFHTDIEEIEDILNQWYKHLTQFQFDSLLSFVFDIGIEGFYKTKIPLILNDGLPMCVPREMLKIMKFHSQDKIKRRKLEINIFAGESYSRPVIGGVSSAFAMATDKRHEYDIIGLGQGIYENAKRKA